MHTEFKTDVLVHGLDDQPYRHEAVLGSPFNVGAQHLCFDHAAWAGWGVTRCRTMICPEQCEC